MNECLTGPQYNGCLVGIVEWWNGCMCFLVHVGNNCIRVVAEISEMKFWHERYL